MSMGSIAARHARAVLAGRRADRRDRTRCSAAQALDLRLGARCRSRRPGLGVAEALRADPRSGSPIWTRIASRDRISPPRTRSCTTASWRTSPVQVTEPARGPMRPASAAVRPALFGPGSLGQPVPDVAQGPVDLVEIRPALATLLEPHEVAGIAPARSRRSTSRCGVRTRGRAGRPTGRPAGAAGAIALRTPVDDRPRAVRTVRGVRRRRVAAACDAPRRSASSTATPGAALPVADPVEGGVDPHHLDGRAVTGDVGMERARQPSMRRGDRSVVSRTGPRPGSRTGRSYSWLPCPRNGLQDCPARPTIPSGGGAFKGTVAAL